MQEYQERVVKEEKELDEKIGALDKFINVNPVFFTLPKEEQGRMKEQLYHMGKYSDVLRERIENFV